MLSKIAVNSKILRNSGVSGHPSPHMDDTDRSRRHPNEATHPSPFVFVNNIPPRDVVNKYRDHIVGSKIKDISALKQCLHRPQRATVPMPTYPEFGAAIFGTSGSPKSQSDSSGWGPCAVAFSLLYMCIGSLTLPESEM